METLKVPGGHRALAFASSFLGTSPWKVAQHQLFWENDWRAGWSLTHAAVISDTGLLRLKIWPRKPC